MTKWRVITLASACMTAAGVATAISQTPGTSGATETVMGAQASAEFITCEDIVDVDDVVAGQVVYFVAGHLEGQRAAALDHSETPNEGTGTGPSEAAQSSLGIEATETNTETDEAASPSRGASRLLAIELDVEQVRSVCEDDPRMTISAIIEQTGG